MGHEKAPTARWALHLTIDVGYPAFADALRLVR
jgi:hypothetical protein